jgi:aryl-alcohol dehydrogenase-like predicted oxidoreductase
MTGAAVAATRAGTEAFRARALAAGAVAGHYRDLGPVLVSSVGIGTYLGPYTPRADEDYASAVVRAVELGTNFIDSAVNYRFQRSERSIGTGLTRLFAAGTARREELVIATKGGYIPFDGAPPADSAVWIREHVLDPGLAPPAEVVAGCHCMTAEYLRNQLEQSLENLGLASVDLYYVHNPEQQLDEIERDEFERRLGRAFAELERAAGEGKLGGYGLATWNGFRADPRAPEYLSLERAVELARAAAGGGDHHLVAVQLPFNLRMDEARAVANQVVGGKAMSLLDAARALGVAVVASASLLQGRLSRGLPEQLAQSLGGLKSDAQRALQFARSTPGVAAALVGMRKAAHVEENLELRRIPPDPDAVEAMFAPRS